MTEQQWTDWRGVDESGWYWWWNEDEDSAPVPVSVMFDMHGYFASTGQLGLTRAQYVSEMEGRWKKLPEPDVCKDIEEQRIND